MLIIGVYVDDLLMTGTSTALIGDFKTQMSERFDMSNLGKLSYYLGMEVEQGSDYVEIKQAGYARKLLERFRLLDCNPTKFPMDPKESITKDEGGKLVDTIQFKSLVGRLCYLVHTRPDIAYSVGIISRFVEKPTIMHLHAAKRLLRYIRGTLEYGLVYAKNSGNNLLSGYSDSDLAGHVDDQRSTGGMVFYLNESLITWVLQKQRCVALSSCEAESMAVTTAACQTIWLRNLLG
ncbi:secreted RxLR effector protein 161-like [Apium graveolens]|uniref:secreted RxLR effector protein 161-like n=1 Tax=Apium graveolens TaxID=4045 RepID=UPI003D794C44